MSQFTEGMEFLVDIPEHVYHADPCIVPSLSASTAKALIEKSPRKAYLEHPKLGGMRRKTTKQMDRGTVVHALVLNQKLNVEVLDFPDFRTNLAKTARDLATASGNVPDLREEMGQYMEMANNIRANLKEHGIELCGKSEGTALWKDHDDDGNEVQCRSRFDHSIVQDGTFWVIDLKTCADANPRVLTQQILNYGYDLQAAAYVRAVEKSDPQWQGRVKFLFLFAEDNPPYPVTPILLDGAFRHLGQSKWRRAVNIWSDCLRNNRWPSYTVGPIHVSPPQWAIKEEFEMSPTYGRELATYLES